LTFENRILYIIKTKSGKPRKVELNHTAIDTLNKIKRHPKSEYVFCDSEGNKYFTVRKSFNNALKKAGLENEGIVFHSLRHTFAAHLLMKGSV